MDYRQRKRLPHDIPLFVDTAREIYFITICCAERGRNQLTTAPIASALFDSLVHQNARKVWHAHLFILMPDHVHALLSFPQEGRPLKENGAIMEALDQQQARYCLAKRLLRAPIEKR